MGTRSAAKIKLRSAAYKCDVCGRRLMSAEALRSHQVCVHNITAKVKTKIGPSKQSVAKSKIQPQSQKVKNLKLEKIAIKPKPSPTKKISDSSKPPLKVVPKPVGKFNVETSSEYECPQCMKTFRVYFSAHRHIQKSHCVNSSGEKVSPNSPNLIKPIVRKVCAKCNKRLKIAEVHKCQSVKYEQEEMGSPTFYICAGCKQQFLNLRLFDIHVAGLHCDGVESMFFPNNEVFMSWKTDMEKQTKIRYSILGKYSYKQMLRCTHLPDGASSYDDTISFLCPSSIVVQEFSKGIQVHYYKDHYGHTCPGYSMSDKYKKFSLTTLLKNTDGYTQIDELNVDENDLYLQFKQLMECIVLDAARINVDSLKTLIGKALDMTSVLNNYEEDPDSVAITKKVVESNTSEGNSNGEKRKVATEPDISKSEPITKRFKTRMYQHNDISTRAADVASTALLQDTSIKIINSFSLAEQDISKAINTIDSDNDHESQAQTNKQPKDNEGNDSQNNSDKEKHQGDDSPASFADSYKDFVVRNFKLEGANRSKSKIKSNMPSKSHMIKAESPKPQSVTKESTSKSTVMKPLVKPSKTESPTPQSRPKSSEPVLNTLPVDYKYEVKERENECNILILKI